MEKFIFGKQNLTSVAFFVPSCFFSLLEDYSALFFTFSAVPYAPAVLF